MAGRTTIGFWQLVLYATAITFGIRWLATAAAAGPAALPVWIAAALGFLAPLAVATAELAGRFEGEGAIYAWTRNAFGAFPGFLCGWIYWMSNLPFFSSILFFAIEVIAYAAPPALRPAFEAPAVRLGLATAIALAITLLNLIGLRAAKWLPAAGAVASVMLLALLLLAGSALALRDGPATDFASASYAPPLSADGAILWGTMVFGFAGAEGVALLRNDIEGGMRRLVRAIALIGVFLVVAYVGGTVAMLTILAPEQASRLSGLPEAIQAGLERLGLGQTAPWALLLLAGAALGGYAAWFGVSARLPYAAGLDRVLPRAFAYRDPKSGAPVASIWLQGVTVIVLLFLSQAGATIRSAYDFLIAMSVLSYTLPFLFLFAAFLRVQRTSPPAGAWRAPGGARGAFAIGAIGFLVTLSAVLCTLVPSPDAPDALGAVFKLVWSSAVLVLSGVALYALAVLRRHKRGPPS